MRATIHTDAAVDAPILAGLDRLRDVEVFAGEAAGGGPDCIYGWGEAKDRVVCRAHTLVVSDDLESLAALSRMLVAHMYQVVITEHEDWSRHLGFGASYYTDDHQH